MQRINFKTYYKKLCGCFSGKVIGGTLGMPFEGSTKIRDISYYEPIPTEMVANDDLDLQVVWLECIINNGFPINRKNLADAWLQHIRCAFDEYGVTLRNLSNGIPAPASGAFDNKFYNGMGSAIRTEIWGAICPGSPELAVSFAVEDACVDHCKDGIHASQFIAAIESMAFIESDIYRLIDIGLSYLPNDCRLKRGITDVIKWWKDTKDVFAVRENLITKYPCDNWTDVTINLGIIVLSLLYGNGDFSKSICMATNLGYDTDCTAATLGSILGIINPDSIGEEWKKPIGNKLVLSDYIVGMHEVDTIDMMCEQLAALCQETQDYYKTNVVFDNAPQYQSIIKGKNSVFDSNVLLKNAKEIHSGLIAIKPIYITVKYPQQFAITPNIPSEFELKFYNPLESTVNLKATLSGPNGFKIDNDEFSTDIGTKNELIHKFKIQLDTFSHITQLNFININLYINGLPFALKFGVSIMIPWLVLKASENVDINDEQIWKNAEVVYSTAVQAVPKGKNIYSTNFRIPERTPITLLAQGCPLKMWIDGKLMIEHKNNCYTPAYHREVNDVRMIIESGWHNVVIETDNFPSAHTFDELFFGIGNTNTLRWVNDVEWRLPKN